MKKLVLAAVCIFSLLSGSSKNIIPVISRLNAVNKDGKILIEWTRNESSNTAMYELESSLDGKSFKTIAYIMPAAEIKNYAYRDKVSDKNTYYRLKEIDNVGQVSYTTTRVVKQNNNIEDVKIAATTDGKVYIQFKRQPKENFIVAITSLNGNTLTQYDYQAAKKVVFTAPLHLKSFVVTVKNSNNLNVSKQIVL